MRYAEQGDLLEGLSILRQEEYRKLQESYPVISLPFANIKEKTYEMMEDGAWMVCQKYIGL